MRTESEIWKDIVGYEGYYQVSSLGRIKPLKRKDGRGAVVVNGFKAQSVSNTGYYRTVLNKDGEQFNISPHRLVATAFVPNPKNKPCVDHINGNKLDNRAENLRWCTRYENSANAKAHKDNKTGIKGISLTTNKYQRAQYWEAQVKSKGVRHRVLFPFNKKEEAIEWIQNKRKELHGDFAKH